MSEEIKNKLIAALIFKQISIKFQSYELAVHFRDIEKTIDYGLEYTDRDSFFKEFNYSLGNGKLEKDWVAFFENTSDSSILSEVSNIITSKVFKDSVNNIILSYITKTLRDRKISFIL